MEPTEEPVVIDPLQRLRARNAQYRETIRVAQQRQAEEAKVQEAIDKRKEWTIAGEAWDATRGAAVDLVTEGFIFAKDFAKYAGPAGGAMLMQRVAAGQPLVSEDQELFNEDLRRSADRLAPDNKTIGGNIGRTMLQFLVPYTKMASVTKGATTLKEATAMGFAIDFSLFDPNQGNLSNLIGELAPDTKDTVLTFLATDPDDDEALNRLRNGLEGVGLGLALEGIFRFARQVGWRKKIDEEIEAGLEEKTPVEKPETAPKEEPDLDEVVDEAGDAKTADELDGEAAVKAEEHLHDTLRNQFDIPLEVHEKLQARLLDGDEEGFKSILDQHMNIDKLDWDKIKEADDVFDVLDVTARAIGDALGDAGKKSQSWTTTARMANLVQTSAEQVDKLHRDLTGGVGLTARYHASRRILTSSVKRALELRDVAKQTKSPKDRAAFMKHMELHVALQAAQSESRSEIARALNSMKMIDAQVDDGFREFDEVMRSYGTGDGGKHSFEKFMDDLLDADDIETIGARMREASRAGKWKNAFIEWTINSMLSSLKTHAINITSNTLNLTLYSMDRLLAGAGRRVLAGDKAAWREAKIEAWTKLSKLDEAFALARQAWKDGAPVTDKRQRLEFMTRKAIAMDGDTALAKTVNAIGEVVRIPGRALITGDEFFKAITRNAEISALAYRHADELATKRGLEFGTDEYEKFVTKAMHALKDPEMATKQARDIRSKAIEKSRLAAFQESAYTEMGAKMESFINANWLFKLVVAPFFRTPMNILRQGVVDRTPLAALTDVHWETLTKGHPMDQAETMARMTTGVAAMAGFWSLIGDDESAPIQVVGKVPYDSSEKAAGVLDYSLRIGDEWYQFNRLDPLGLWLGMTADARTHYESGDEQGAYQLMAGAIGGFMNNVTNKTWAKSLADLYELFADVNGRKKESWSRAFAKFSASQAGKTIPQFLKSTGTVAAGGDELTVREAWTFVENMQKQLPVFNESLPPRHDFLGRPITWKNRKSALVNPFAISDDPTELEKEMARLDFTVEPMEKTLGGGKVQLTAAEYSKLTGLVGTITARGKTLEETLDDLRQSDKYQGWSDLLRAYQMKRIITKFRGAARNTFLADPANSSRLKDAKVQYREALLAGPDE